MITFTKTTPEKAKAVLDRLMDKKSQAEEALRKANADHGQVLLAVEEGHHGSKDLLEAVRRSIKRAKSALEEANIAIRAAKSRYQDALEQQRQAEEKKQWDQAEKIGDRRMLLAEKIQNDSRSLSKHLLELKQLSLEQYQAAPGRKESSLPSSPLAPDYVENCVRREMLKAGCKWAFAKWPWSEDQIPDLSEDILEGNNWLLKQRKLQESGNFKNRSNRFGMSPTTDEK